MVISPSFTRMVRPKRADKASLSTASGMLLHAVPSMSVSSLREFPEHCVYRHDGFLCFIKIINYQFLFYDIESD